MYTNDDKEFIKLVDEAIKTGDWEEITEFYKSKVLKKRKKKIRTYLIGLGTGVSLTAMIIGFIKELK